MCNVYRFSTATVVTRTPLYVTLYYVAWLFKHLMTQFSSEYHAQVVSTYASYLEVSASKLCLEVGCFLCDVQLSCQSRQRKFWVCNSY